MADISHWVWWGTAIGLGVLGMGLLGWALLWDRSRGRLRCPRCWYRMEGAPEGEAGPRCPECGRTIGRARALRRTRRRWRWAVVSCLLLVGAEVSWVTPRGLRDGWLSVVPTTALLLAPVDVVGPMLDPWPAPDPGRPGWLMTMHGELEDRVEAAPLWGWQDSILGWRVERAARRLGDGPVPPGSQELFERMCRSSVVLPGGPLSIDELAALIERQTNFPCRSIHPDGEAARVDTAAGTWTVAQVFDALEGWWKDDDIYLTWTIQDGTVVIASEEDIQSAPGAWRVRCYDLGRGAAWAETMPYVAGCFVASRFSSELSNYEFYELLDVIEWSIAPEGFITGGGRASARRFGRWLVVRAPTGLHVRIEALLRAIENEDAVVRLASGSVDSWSGWGALRSRENWPEWVVYDLTPILTADSERQAEILEAFGTQDPPSTGTSPFASPGSGAYGDSIGEYLEDIGSMIEPVVDPGSWLDSGGGAGRRNIVGTHLLIRQTAQNHQRIGQVLEALEARRGHGATTDGAGEPLAWRVYDTTPLWKAVFARPYAPRFIGIAEINLRGELFSELDVLMADDSPSRDTERVWWQQPGRLVARASPEELDQIGAWLDAALHDDATLDLLAGIRDPDDE